MNNDSVIWGLLLLALLSANVPFLNNRLYFIKRIEVGSVKPTWMRFVELIVLYFIVGLIGLALENKINGQIHPQEWEFYAITFVMFVVFAVPGFIYQYTYKKQ